MNMRKKTLVGQKNKSGIIPESACFCHFFAVYSYMINKEKIMKTNNTPLQKFKYITGDLLIGFLMDRFDYTAKQAIKMEKRLPGGLKVQVI